jgi:hypothetical protein
MIPEHVKIGGYNVNVRLIPNMIPDSSAYGQYIPRAKEIQIDPSACEEQQYGTFVHEILEAITEIYEIPSLTNNHHDLVLLGEALHQIFRDNPRIFQEKGDD